MTVVLVGGAEHLAVDVDLHLCGRRVANAHGPGGPVAFEIECGLRRATCPPDAVENLRSLITSATDCALHPVGEISRYFLVSNRRQRRKHERRIAQPRKAIVPVAFTADRLG